MIEGLLAIVLFVAFAGFQILDAYTTYRALRDNTADEANPIARWFFNHLGLIPSLIGLKAIFLAIGAALAFVSGSPISLVALGILTAVGLIVLINNIRVTTAT